MLDWLIIGGGIHGTYLSNVLNSYYLVGPRNRLKFRVLDPQNSPLFWWKHTTRNCKMVYLRSPRVHHIGLSPSCLHKFSMTQSEDGEKSYAPPYHRPSLKLFFQHSQWVIDQNRLNRFRLQARAKKIIEIKNGLRVITTNGEIDARRIILCLGLSEQPFWPRWALKVKKDEGNVHHIFDRKFKVDKLKNTNGLVVIGGGITAIQFVLAHANSRSNPIVLIMRHEKRIHLFDSDPGWIGPKFLSSFHEIKDFNLRRKILNDARNQGSIPEDSAILFTNKIKEKKINLVIGEPTSIVENTEGYQIVLDKQVRRITARSIVLATGFQSCIPGGDFMNNTIQELNLSTANCGYPISNPALRWHPRIFISGPLAELEIGPVSRNIIGARIAAKRIAAAF